MIVDRWAFVLSAYGVSVLVLSVLIIWIVVARRAAKRELTALEASGIKRRSES